MISREPSALAAATAAQSGYFTTAKFVNFLPTSLESCDMGSDCDKLNETVQIWGEVGRTNSLWSDKW
jgi:putative heme iron utilization protein